MRNFFNLNKHGYKELKPELDFVIKHGKQCH